MVLLKPTSAPELRTSYLALIFVVVLKPISGIIHKGKGDSMTHLWNLPAGIKMAISFYLSPKTGTRIATKIQLSSHRNREDTCASHRGKHIYPGAGSAFSHCLPLLLYPESGGDQCLGKC